MESNWEAELQEKGERKGKKIFKECVWKICFIVMNFNLLSFCFIFWKEIKESKQYRKKYENVTNLKLNICIPRKGKWEKNLTNISFSSGFIMRCLQIISPILNINYRITNAHLLLCSLCHLIIWALELINFSFL